MRSGNLKLILAVFLVGLVPGLWAQDGLEGALSRVKLASPPNFAEPFAQTLTVADFDNDNKPDGAVLVDSSRTSGRNSFRIELHLSGSKDTSLSFESPESGLTITASDVNRDGVTDVVVERSLTHKRLYVWLGDGHGGFQKGRVEDFPSPETTGHGLKGPLAVRDFPAVGLPSQGDSWISVLAASAVRGRPPSANDFRPLGSLSSTVSNSFSAISSRAPPTFPTL